MLPGLHLIFPKVPPGEHHLFVAAAMTVNVAVALPAALQHAKAGAVRRDLLPPLLGSTLFAIVLGVLTSNLAPADVLKLGLAIFILAYCGFNVWRLTRAGMEPAVGDRASERTSLARLLVCGACAGAAGGLLGLGGGVVLVPMLQLVCRVPLRQSIATSTAVISITAMIGAGVKLGTLGEHQLRLGDALWLALLMAPLAIFGGRLGAWLTHAMPIRSVRLAVTALLAVAAANLIRTAL